MSYKKIPSFVKIMLVAGLLFGIFFGVGAGLTAYMQQPEAEEAFNPDLEKNSEDDFPAKVEGNRTNILLLGVDAREGETNSRSDTMIFISIDPKLDQAAVISIPRDTRVTIKGTTTKINEANFYGGPKLAVSTVEDLISTKIDYYVEMDFAGFKNIIDIIGGVTYNVPQRMYRPYEQIDLQPGTQELNGYKALGLVRFRDYANGDIQRAAVQQDFIKTLAAEVLQTKTLTKLPKIVQELKKNVDTNMKLTDMVKIISWAPGFTNESIVSQTLPGSFYDQLDAQGHLAASYWEADKKQAKTLLDTMFSGNTVAVIQNSTSPRAIPRPKEDTGAGGDTQDNGDPTETDAQGYLPADSTQTTGQNLTQTSDPNQGQVQDKDQNPTPPDSAGAKPDDGHGLIDNQPANADANPQSSPGTNPDPAPKVEPAPENVDPAGPEGYI